MICATNRFSRTAMISSPCKADTRKKKIVMSCSNSQRKLNTKSAPFSPRGSAINPAAMFIDDPLRICETETGAIALRGEERNEKMSSLFLGHATTVIADGHQGFCPMPLRGHGKVSSIRHCIQCIADQIQNRFPELLRVDANRG